MHTEDEARKKWCPFARVVMGIDLDTMAGIVGNRHGPMDVSPGIVAQACCIASECMAWRWGSPKYEIHPAPKPTNRIERGYCGLAGEPR